MDNVRYMEVHLSGDEYYRFVSEMTRPCLIGDISYGDDEEVECVEHLLDFNSAMSRRRLEKLLSVFPGWIADLANVDVCQ